MLVQLLMYCVQVCNEQRGWRVSVDRLNLRSVARVEPAVGLQHLVQQATEHS